MKFYDKKEIEICKILPKLQHDKAPILKDLGFRDCHIYGPGVLVPFSEDGNSIVDCTFGISRVEEAFWKVQPNEDGDIFLAGGIGLDNVKFIRCHLINVAFVVHPDRYQSVIDSFKDPSPQTEITDQPEISGQP